jgi:hypothetical protein
MQLSPGAALGLWQLAQERTPGKRMSAVSLLAVTLWQLLHATDR